MQQKQTKKTAADNLPVHLFDHAAEMFVVGSVMEGGLDQFRAVHAMLTVDDLAGHTVQKVWGLCCELAESGEEPSQSNVMRLALQRGAQLSFSEVLSITEHAVPGASLDGWVKMLRKKSIDREAYRLGEVIRIHTEYGLSERSEEITDARERLARLERVALDRNEASTFASLVEDCGGLDSVFARPENVIEPPFPLLRKYMNGGFTPGSVTVVGARPSVGKTAFALQCALAAAGAGRKTDLFSLEMQKPEIIKRIFSMVGNIDHGRLVRGILDRQDREKVRSIQRELNEWELRVYCDIHDLRGIEAKIASVRPRCEFAVIDYLGLIETRQRAENRNQELSYLSRRMKLLAMDANIPVMVLHQLNRSAEKDDRRPVLSDLRDSGSIEQDANNVLFIHQPGARKPDYPKDEREIIIAKQRNGDRDLTIGMKFVGQFVRFEERSEERERMAS